MSRVRTLIQGQIRVLVVHFYNEALRPAERLLLVCGSYRERKKSLVLSYLALIVFNGLKNHIDLASIASNY